MLKVDEKVRSRIWSLQTQIGKGLLDGTHDPEKFADVLQAFLEKKVADAQEHTILEQAINILGYAKVITAEEAVKTWDREVPKDRDIRYSEATLRVCAEQNKTGADWRLVCIHGLSLREQRDKRRTDQSNQSCFFYTNAWWLEGNEDEWATYKPQAGYYLINFCGQFANMNWKTQEAEIAKLGKDYERCHEAVFSEAILTNYMVNNGERIAEDWWHWGVSLSSNGYRVSVGHLNTNGLIVSDSWLGYSALNLRVCVYRKFDY